MILSAHITETRHRQITLRVLRLSFILRSSFFSVRLRWFEHDRRGDPVMGCQIIAEFSLN